jgi:hypothetical protein
MAKPSQRHSSHVQAEGVEAHENVLPDVAAAPPESKPLMQSSQARGGLWLALVLWTFVFGFLFVYLLLDLVFSFFRR